MKEVYMMVTTISVALITAIIGPILLAWVKSKIDKTKSTTIKEAIDLNEMVDVQLENLLKELECDRIWIAQFHNGGHFYPTGKSIQKFSIFYEIQTPNLVPCQHTFQNIPTSFFPKALAKLYKDGEIQVTDYDNEEVYGLETFAREFGTKSFYMISIKDLNGHFIGIMGISFINHHHVLSNNEWILIRQKIGSIGTLLTDYLYKKK
jgi:hypothetical protein